MNLVLTGYGAVTSVGRTAASTCAAIRAGVSGARGMDLHLANGSDAAGSHTRINAHGVRYGTEGFLGHGRWLQLARQAWEDLRRAPALAKASERSFWERTALLVVAPRWERARWPWWTEGDGSAFFSKFQQVLHRELGPGLPPPIPSDSIHEDSAGIGSALQRAQHRLGHDVDRVLVMAIDSLVEPDSLQWLSDQGRLKHGDLPVGMIPGEAGVCLLLEGEDSRDAPSKTRAYRIDRIHTGTDVNPMESDVPPSGTGILQGLREGLPPEPTDGKASPMAPHAVDIVSDLNGEPWRFYEWGMVQSRLGAERADRLSVRIPAVSVGDVGAAQGALGLVVAAEAFARGYARGRQAVVVSRSPHGPLALVTLRPWDATAP